ncbi:STAS domain-containing protein [Raineya orbicola]|jgi:anti-anti-sigma factor|uniref:Anti-sigma factor antagonist n=1 Tax=Raineya orbicola TaxID=2016530 RepID=A0A2N3I975_9BACT|nr:STAS domain-containing protein [Raineya orbicola]PKQ66881.1 Anti-anti-sigma factor [Raineya orbicola]
MVTQSIFEIREAEKYYLLKILANKLDASNALEIKQAVLGLKDKNVKNLIINLNDVKYIDSSGLSAILVAHKVCTETQGIMVLCGVSEHVLKLIKISQLDKVLDILPTEEEAVDAVFMKELEKEFGAEDEFTE